MDIPRPSRKLALRRRRILIGALITFGVVGVTLGLSKLEPAAREVEFKTLFTGSVERGEMLRAVRGPGTLVPKEIRIVTSERDGVVERRLVEAGSQVTADTVIVELSNPELEQELQEANLQLLGVQAEYNDLKARLDSQLLNQHADLARVKADFEGAQLEAKANEELFKANVISSIVLRRSELEAGQTTERLAIEKQRLEKIADSNTQQLTAKQSEIDQRRAVRELRREQLESLAVRAAIDGVLQEVSIEVGERVNPGMVLARVAQQKNLKAELRINETQAKDVVIGQIARIDTRNGIVEGRVSRIDPSVINGSVTVDVELTGELPPGARPDLSVDGTVELERLEDTLYVSRPTYVQANSQVKLFKLDPEGKTATRVPVRLGRTSVQTVEIIEGLALGETVILSDTSAFDEVDRIRLRY